MKTENVTTNTTSYCSGCRNVTSWTQKTKKLVCDSCKTAFPCSYKCDHWDCREARGEARADKNGVLRLIATLLLFVSPLPLFSCASDNPNLNNPDANPASPPTPPGSRSPNSPYATHTPGAAPQAPNPAPLPAAMDGQGSAGGDAGAVDARALSQDSGAAASDARAAGDGVPSILQPSPEMPKCFYGGKQRGCPFLRQEPTGVFSLNAKVEDLKGQISTIGCVMPVLESGPYGRVYWVQEYEGVKYLIGAQDPCGAGRFDPAEKPSYTNLNDLSLLCSQINGANNLGQVDQDWIPILGVKQIRTIEITRNGYPCAKVGQCKWGICIDSNGKVLK
jgi:hypothetical protein